MEKRLKKPGVVPTAPKILTVREVSEYLHVHPTTIYRCSVRSSFLPFAWVRNGDSTSIRSIAGAPSKSKRQRALGARPRNISG